MTRHARAAIDALVLYGTCATIVAGIVLIVNLDGILLFLMDLLEIGHAG